MTEGVCAYDRNEHSCGAFRKLFVNITPTVAPILCIEVFSFNAHHVKVGHIQGDPLGS